eukprot:16506-Heterococcus_DN1.PRE.1
MYHHILLSKVCGSSVLAAVAVAVAVFHSKYVHAACNLNNMPPAKVHAVCPHVYSTSTSSSSFCCALVLWRCRYDCRCRLDARELIKRNAAHACYITLILASPLCTPTFQITSAVA